MKKEIIILFDLDGTLIDSTDAILSGFYHSFEELNFNFKGNDEDIKKYIGYPLDDMYVKLGVKDAKKWDFVDSYKRKYRTISKNQTVLLEKAFEAVQEASKIARLSVVTTKTKSYTIPLLENLNILNHFEIITGRECVQNPKPHPEPILNTLNQMDYEPSKHEVYMIGDTKLDLIAAKEANINSIAVLCGYGKENELKLHTNIIKQNAFEAISHIKEVFKD